MLYPKILVLPNNRLHADAALGTLWDGLRADDGFRPGFDPGATVAPRG